jgi:hypothetical protein
MTDRNTTADQDEYEIVQVSEADGEPSDRDIAAVDDPGGETPELAAAGAGRRTTREAGARRREPRRQEEFNPTSRGDETGELT